MGVYVHGGGPTAGPVRNIGVGHLQHGENQRAEHRQRYGTRKYDQWVSERVELDRQNQKDHQNRHGKSGQKLVALSAQLARLAGVIDTVARWQDLRGSVLQEG